MHDPQARTPAASSAGLRLLARHDLGGRELGRKVQVADGQRRQRRRY
jgi:hypothetical protein